MTKVLHCRDLGTGDCDFIARGETIEDVLAIGAKHGAEVHGMAEMSEEMIEQVKSLVREE